MADAPDTQQRTDYKITYGNRYGNAYGNRYEDPSHAPAADGDHPSHG